MKTHFIKYKNEYISVGILMMTTLVLQILLLQLWKMSIAVPLEYSGSEGMSSLLNAKMFISQNWNLSCDRLGAPYSTQYYDLTSSMLHNFDLITLKIFSMLTGDAAVALNIQYLSTYFLIALISYLVMRELKITNWIAICGSLLFTFMSYIFMRGILHMALTTYYFIPLSILLCFWIYERDDILVFNRQFFKNKRNLLSIFFVILIANNGIAYYPFFTCYLLIITAISKVIKTKNFKIFIKSAVVIAGIVLCMMVNLIPRFIYQFQNGPNSAIIIRDGVSGCEELALKLIQLFLPVDGHRIPIIGAVIDEYNNNSFYVNENMTSYLGIIGICGFLVLIFALFIKKESILNGRLSFLSEMNIAMVFLGTVGGFSAVFAVLVSNNIRAYNRISIFMAYVCILTVAFMVDAFYRKHKKKYIVIIGSIITIFCIWEQFPTNRIPEYETNYYNYYSDKNFVAEIEGSVDKGAMIFQMPYHEDPEGGQVYEMTDYPLYTGYIHSNTLKWSYGSIKGREGSDWIQYACSKSIEETVSHIKDAGFAGIYIDRRAYEPDKLKKLENKLTDVLESTPIYSENENLSFFKLKEVHK